MDFDLPHKASKCECAFLWICGHRKSLMEPPSVLCLGLCGKQSWKPWLVSGLMELSRYVHFCYAFPLYKSEMTHFLSPPVKLEPICFSYFESVVSKFPVCCEESSVKGVLRFALLLSSVSQFFTKRNFRMGGRRPRWGDEPFSCSITSCVRPSTTNTRSKLDEWTYRVGRTALFLECDLMAVTLNHLQGKDSLPAQTYGR